MKDLSTSYLGLSLRNPLVASASPLCEDLDNLKKMDEAGVGAIVLHSLFEEQIEHESEELDARLSEGSEAFAEALSYFPQFEDFKLAPEAYVEHIGKAKAAVEVPIIASLNGVSGGGWTRYAKKLEAAGADALELNIYSIPTDPELTPDAVEKSYVDLVSEVVKSVKIPVAVKIGPWFSALPHTAKQIAAAGARGLVLFNRFYQPDFDLEKLEVVPNMQLSSSSDLRLRLRWVAILFGRIDVDFAVTGGVHSTDDVIKSMMAGARVAMTTSALLRNGIGHIELLQKGLLQWLETHEYESIAQMQGSMSQRAVADPRSFERATYIKTLKSGR